MIFLMSQKAWNKNKKKLVIPKDYVIFDATEDDDTKMNSYTNCVTMDAFNPPIKMVKLATDDDFDDMVDFDKVEKLERQFFNGLRLKQAIMASIAGLIENGDVNIFIVMRNKAFKIYKKRMKKTFEKLFPVDFTFIEVFSEDVSDHKRNLRKTLAEFEIDELQRCLRKNEKDSEMEYKKRKKKRRW